MIGCFNRRAMVAACAFSFLSFAAVAAEPQAAPAAPASAVMFYNTITVKPEAEAALVTWVQGHVMPMTAKLPGYLGGGMLKDMGTPGRFYVIGQWTSRAAMDDWMKKEGELVKASDQALINPLRGNVKEEPRVFETKETPFRIPAPPAK